MSDPNISRSFVTNRGQALYAAARMPGGTPVKISHYQYSSVNHIVGDEGNGYEPIRSITKDTFNPWSGPQHNLQGQVMSEDTVLYTMKILNAAHPTRFAGIYEVGGELVEIVEAIGEMPPEFNQIIRSQVREEQLFELTEFLNVDFSLSDLEYLMLETAAINAQMAMENSFQIGLLQTAIQNQ